MTQAKILPAGPEHIGALMALYADFRAEQGQPIVTDERENFGVWCLQALQDNTRRVWVAMVGKKVVGFRAAAFIALQFGPHRRQVHGICLYVRPESRKYGVGRDLSDQMTAWAKDLGVPQFGQCTDDSLSYWEHLGWTVAGHIIMKES